MLDWRLLAAIRGRTDGREANATGSVSSSPFTRIEPAG